MKEQSAVDVHTNSLMCACRNSLFGQAVLHYDFGKLNVSQLRDKDASSKNNKRGMEKVNPKFMNVIFRTRFRDGT